jgi:FemAB-related protein (PEP-CTERM system-associated)
VTVVGCDDSHREAWDAYVRRAPGASFYHRYGWRDINREEFGHRSLYLAAFEDDRIVGVFPIVNVKSRLFGNLACSMPFVNFGGPCGDSEAAEQALIDEAGQYVHRSRMAYLEMRNRRRLSAVLPTSEHKVSMTVDLVPDPDTLWKAFKTDHRRDIRRAYKYGLSARFGGLDLLDPFYDILAESWHGLGTPLYRKRYFERILRTFERECRICVVFAGAELAAAAFDGSHGETVEGMWLGVRDKYRAQLAGYVLYWELIKDACQRGFRRFHLGRSTSESAGEVFKRKWNAVPHQLYWQYLLGTRREIPSLNVENPRYRAAIRLWQRLPVGVVRRIGPSIARSIP